MGYEWDDCGYDSYSPAMKHSNCIPYKWWFIAGKIIELHGGCSIARFDYSRVLVKKKTSDRTCSSFYFTLW